MKCEYCGTVIPDGAEECPACGAGIELQTKKTAAEETTPAKEVNEQKINDGKFWTAAVVTALLVIGILAGIWIYRGFGVKKGFDHASGWQTGKAVTYTISDGVTLEMMPCPAGSFTMGSLADEEGRSDDEKPHRVTLTKPFLIGKYEVTQAQYKAVMGKNPSDFRGDDRPVESVNWHEAVAFCSRLNEITEGKRPQGYKFTLPTEAQWEYACRAGTATAFCYGNSLDSDMANFDGNYPYNAEKGKYREKTVSVGSFRPNAWGIYDMHGNVREWCLDRYGKYGGDETDPTGPSTGRGYVRRGGSWSSHARSCRSALRSRGVIRNSDLGFRLALVPVQ